MYDDDNGFTTMSTLDINVEKYNYKSEYFYVNIHDKVMNDSKQDEILKREHAQYLTDMQAIKIATTGSKCYIDMSRFGKVKNAMLFAFQEFTKGIKEPEAIDQIECMFLDKLLLSGIMSCKKGTYKNLIKYDFNSYFPSIMSSTKCIPMKAGTPMKISQEEWNEKMQKKHTPKYGMYICDIEKSTVGPTS